MFGFLLIDKPKGANSFQVVRSLRRVCNLRRVGYSGTLDPLASGLMITAIGEATKLLAGLEKLDKVYEVSIQFGATSATYDAEGPITVHQVEKKPSKSEIQKVLKAKFLGEQWQMPPVYSAIKIGGKRAYNLARKGLTVDLKKRKVQFFSIKIKRYRWPQLVCTVHCSSGTYIRSFAHDLGQTLGCGAYVEDLCRLKVDSYSIKNAVLLDKITAQNVRRFLLSPQKFFKTAKQVILNESEYKILANGGFISNHKKCKTGQLLAIYKNECVGLLETYDNAKKLKFLKKFNIV